MRQVSILLKMLKHFRIQDLQDDKDKVNYYHTLLWWWEKWLVPLRGKRMGHWGEQRFFFSFAGQPMTTGINGKHTFKRMKQFKGDSKSTAGSNLFSITWWISLINNYLRASQTNLNRIIRKSGCAHVIRSPKLLFLSFFINMSLDANNEFFFSIHILESTISYLRSVYPWLPHGGNCCSFFALDPQSSCRWWPLKIKRWRWVQTLTTIGADHI